VSDTYDDTYGDSYGISGAVTPPTITPDTRPQVVVEMALGSPATLDDAGSGIFLLGSSLLDGTDVLGSLAWVNIADPGLPDGVTSVTLDPGQSSAQESASPSTCTIVVENYSGNFDPLNDASPYAGQLTVGIQARIRYVFPDGTVLDRWRGFVDDIVPDYGTDPQVSFTCSDGLASLGRTKVGEIPPSFDGDTTGARINRILDAALWPTSQRSIATGLVTVQADTYGDFALALIQRIVDTELGALYVDGAGRMTFVDRLKALSPRSTTVEATFSDAGTDVDYTQLPAQVRRGELYNQASVTRDGGVEQVAVDLDSQGQFGPSTYPGQIGTMSRTDADALSLATWTVNRYRAPTTKFPQIAVDATTQNMWLTLLSLRRFSRIRMLRDYGPVSLDQQLTVDGIAEVITAETWTMAFTTRDAETFTPFILNTSKLNSTAQLV
jgi:hypothetical protein